MCHTTRSSRGGVLEEEVHDEEVHDRQMAIGKADDEIDTPSHLCAQAHDMAHHPLLLSAYPRKLAASHFSLPPWAQFDAANFQLGVNSSQTYIWKARTCGFDDDVDINIVSSSHTTLNQANDTFHQNLADTRSHKSIRTSQALA